MTIHPEDLRYALRQLAASDPEFFEELLGERFLLNRCAPARAGKRFVVAPTAIVSPAAHVELCTEQTRIELGPHTFINDYAWLRAWGAGIRLGAHCTLNQYAMVQGEVTMGDGVRIGAHTLFIATEHIFATRAQPIHRQGTRQRGIRLGNDIYVGSNVTVLDGVSIGDGAVIAAGAVVTRDVAPYTVVGGVPARVLKERPQ